MPQLTVYYSADLSLQPQELLAAVELCIAEHDETAGMCKSRAYPAEYYQHTSCYLQVRLLTKPHRDSLFMNQLLEKLTKMARTFLPQHVHLAIDLDFSSKFYQTITT